MGGAYPGGASSGTLTTTSQVNFTLTSADLPSGQNLAVGLLDPLASGGSAGFNSVELNITENGNTIPGNDYLFTALPAAENFFSDNFLNLGTIPGGSTFTLNFTLTLKTQLPFSFDADFGVGSGTIAAHPAATRWANAVNGNWSDASKWTNGVPNANGAQAVFSVATSANVAVTLDAPQTVGSLQFGNSGNASFGYTLNGSGSNKLTLNNLGTADTITVTGGMHTINAPVILSNDLVVAGSGGSVWTLSFGTTSSITDNGQGLSLTMDAFTGTLILSGSDNYGGGTDVVAGTLIVTNPGAIADGSDLDVGTGMLALSAAVVPSSVQSAATVPEPRSTALAAAAAGLLAGWRRCRIWRRRRLASRSGRKHPE
jgi:autotransporter-associated beta strand protein